MGGRAPSGAAYTRWRFDQHFPRNTHSAPNDHRRGPQHALGSKMTIAADCNVPSAPNDRIRLPDNGSRYTISS